MRLGGNSLLGDGCGVMHLGGAGVKWELQARKVGSELGGACLRGGVGGPATLCDERGGGVDRGFSLAPFQVEGCVPSCFIRCFQYSSSSARYTQVVSRPYFYVPGKMRRMFWARFFLLFCSGAPCLRLFSHHAVKNIG